MQCIKQDHNTQHLSHQVADEVTHLPHSSVSNIQSWTVHAIITHVAIRQDLD